MDAVVPAVLPAVTLGSADVVAIRLPGAARGVVLSEEAVVVLRRRLECDVLTMTGLHLGRRRCVDKREEDLVVAAELRSKVVVQDPLMWKTRSCSFLGINTINTINDF